MRVFVTGATGYIGQAIIRALVQAGHEVGGLYRTQEKEGAVRALGAVPVFGNLRDPETYQHFAAESAAVIHAAFESPDLDRTATEHLISALKAEGENKCFVLTSGVLVLGDTGTKAADEGASVERPFPLVAWRPPLERFVLEQANEQLATSVIRPGFVYGGGNKKTVLYSYAESALHDGVSRYVGPGTNHMAYVHRDDLAQLYRLLVEQRARGIFHGVDGSKVTNAELAREVSTRAGKGGKVESIPLEVARKQVGPFADAFAVEQRVVSRRSAELGWRPAHADILDDIKTAITEHRH
jgi:nucleoside-diphosphate-sugar epimerase